LAAAFILQGCSGGSGGGPALKPTITRFSADPASVGPGETSVLHYAVMDAAVVEIDLEGGGALVHGSVLLEGQVPTPPLYAPTTFILTATISGDSATKALTVPVTVGERAAIESFIANPTMVDPAQPVTLSWRTVGAVSGVIRSTSPLYTIAADMVAGGNWTIDQLERSDTYTLAVKGTDGVEVTKDVSIVLNGPQIFSFVATPNPVMRGAPVMLSWVVRNAVELEIDSGTTGVVHRGKDLSGTIMVYPTRADTYTLAATDAQGRQTTADEAVMVIAPLGAPVIRTFGATPETVTLGDLCTVSWSVGSGAQAVEILADDVVMSATTAASGAIGFHPAASTTYALIAKNAAGEATASAAVRVLLGAPVITSFSADPPVLPEGGAVDLSWRTLGADRVQISRDGFVVATASTADSAANGSAEVTLTATAATYVISAISSLGETRAALGVRSGDGPGFGTFNVKPAMFAPRYAVTATVSVFALAASKVELRADGALVPGFPRTLTGSSAIAFSGAAHVPIRSTTRFDLTLTGRNGQETRSRIASAILPEAEPNNGPTYAQALGVLTASTTIDVAGSIVPATDEDWFTITIGGPSSRTALSIWTYQLAGDPSACPTDDTEMWLYDHPPASLTAISSHQEPAIVAYDDDGGPGLCAGIGLADEQGPVMLVPKTYYLRVRRYAAEAEIPRYFVRIVAR
jgi:hypothetical protein